ncbi:hypothetical protein PSM7751_00079 [Pseudooceanicola marinus]|uniref:ATP-grasp domain-containing protein n=1 Tax=Pseudooceanicola marinus TaxID=396013 RepID=A0A1X6Y4W0_9RHOB|nr:sugar-transfer associated ATP-grasp domain-containing protein [Pseudooceanicola marinus]PJE33384.1 hypothetical protein CVM50_03900 [Pseudooceanicola marinus]SLN10424.1 hypothetical protein PSM7751_00079 [Pseudooceanicola marinus]
MSSTKAPTALLAAPDMPKPPSHELIVKVARDYGVSPFRQAREMLQFSRGRQRLGLHEYYTFRLFDPERSIEEKRQFIGLLGNKDLNKRLSPRDMAIGTNVIVEDKIFFEALIKQLGFPTTDTQAVTSRTRHFGNIPRLDTVEAAEAFLLNEARYPLFIKPVSGSRSVGSALISERDLADGSLHLMNGRQIPARAVAEEMFADARGSYLLQSAVQQNATLSDVAGSAVGSMRVVTLMGDQMPEVLYTLWKVPSPSAMSDNYWQDGSMIAEIDPANGQVLQCHRGQGPAREALSLHPVSGKAFTDIRIPHWDAVIDVTTRCHALFAKSGVLGWDIAIGETGPKIIEANPNPHHTLYQLATGNGVLNESFDPKFEAVAAVQKARLEKAKAKSRKKKKTS